MWTSVSDLPCSTVLFVSRVSFKRCPLRCLFVLFFLAIQFLVFNILVLDVQVTNLYVHELGLFEMKEAVFSWAGLKQSFGHIEVWA